MIKLIEVQTKVSWSLPSKRFYKISINFIDKIGKLTRCEIANTKSEIIASRKSRNLLKAKHKTVFKWDENCTEIIFDYRPIEPKSQA